MVRIDIISVLPKLIESPFNASIIKRAIEKKIVEIHFHDLKDYANKRRKQVEDYQFGGGSGMVMMIEPIKKCIDNLKNQRDYKEVIYMTPDAEILNQKIANKLSIKGNLIILCGHYKGVDQRVRDNLVTMEISIGAYVLSGGELPAAVLCDSIIRLIPGVLGNETSALTDSFQDGILAPPVYTRPANFENINVPQILLSGDKAKIDKWREEKAIERTKKIRPNFFN